MSSVDKKSNESTSIHIASSVILKANDSMDSNEIKQKKYNVVEESNTISKSDDIHEHTRDHNNHGDNTNDTNITQTNGGTAQNAVKTMYFDAVEDDSNRNNDNMNHGHQTNQIESNNNTSTTCISSNKNQQQEINDFAAMGKNDNTTDMISSITSPGSKNHKDDETCSRAQEINAFATMANADVIVSPNVDEVEKDAARRKQEMNAFAAMANADVIVSPNAFELKTDAAFSVMTNAYVDVNDIDNDISRRNQEMNAFAAMANADVTEHVNINSPGTSEEQNEITRRNLEMSAFAAMANGDVIASPDVDEMEKDATRRKEDMSAFAAMANADVYADKVNVSNVDESGEYGEPSGRQEMNYFTAEANILNTNNMRKAAQRRQDMMRNNDVTPDDTSVNGIESNQSTMNSSAGTFISAKKQSSDKESNRNLDAALASLESDGVKRNDMMSEKRKNQFVSLGSLPETNQIKQRKPQHNQMYSECVRVAKPLFFGREIHPRIINEAKSLQVDYAHLLSDDSNYELTNVESTFSVFGPNSSFLLPEPLNKSLGDSAKDEVQSNHYVTLYEPVWGDFQRLHREDRILGVEAEQTSTVSNSEGYVDKNEPPELSSPKINDSDNTKLSNQNSTESVIQNDDDTNSSEDVATETGGKYDAADSPDLFSKYARGDFDGYGKSLLWEKNSLPPVQETAVSDLTGTFRQISSDPKGSFEGSELKKQVGLNDNISKALKSLSVNAGLGGTSAASLAAADAGAAAIEAARAISVALKDGRPLSNLEMVGGRVPLYGCDDSPLPVPNDLGIFETKEDQYQSMMQLEAQEMIASRAVPNIFGSIVCPSNCSGPDDGQNWFSNKHCIESAQGMQTNIPPTSFQADKHHHSSRSSRFLSNVDFEYPLNEKSELPSPLPPPPNNRLYQSTARTHVSRDSNVSFHLKYERALDDQSSKNKFDQRIGWWNISDDFGLKPKKKSKNKGENISSLQLPPNRDERRRDFSWAMFPSQDKLVNENRSFAELHPAVDTIKCLPYLSDRDPNVRHVQIETQIVSFPSIGEVEPFFCSMAIWHVDAMRNETDDINWDNSGRISEFLHFDIVSNHEVEQNCKTSLWPHQDSHGEPHSVEVDDCSSNCQLQGTRCGVFALHARYNMENLHAVLIVHKTLAEESELDIYVNPSKQKLDEKNQQTKLTAQDLNRYRQRAGKSAERFGQLLMPFAFGVAPLIQILGKKPPKIPASRAAQIPLFKFNAGDGDTPIINHVLALGSSR